MYNYLYMMSMIDSSLENLSSIHLCTLVIYICIFILVYLYFLERGGGEREKVNIYYINIIKLGAFKDINWEMLERK